MAVVIVVEPGTGSAASNSYLSVADAAIYHENMGNATWAASLTADKETALIRATKSLDSIYNGSWKGTKFSSTQALAWPRDYAYDELENEMTGVPVVLKNVTAEAALIELDSPGALLASRTRGGGIKSEKVDVITIEYSDASSLTTVYPTISAMISPLVLSGRGALSVLRC